MIDMTDAEVAKHWDGNADQWTRDVREGFDVYRDHFTFPAFLECLPSIDGLDVIDFGCGEGTNTRTFARLGARVNGIPRTPLPRLPVREKHLFRQKTDYLFTRT